MKKLIKTQLWMAPFICLALAIIAIGILSATGKTQVNPGWIIGVLVVSLAYFLFSLTVAFGFSGIEKDWFKTAEQLYDEKQKSTESWNKANKLVQILGEHEAIKLWEANKEKEKQPEKNIDQISYDAAKVIFETEEGRPANMNNTRDMNAVAAIQTGYKYALQQKK